MQPPQAAAPGFEENSEVTCVLPIRGWGLGSTALAARSGPVVTTLVGLKLQEQRSCRTLLVRLSPKQTMRDDVIYVNSKPACT